MTEARAGFTPHRRVRDFVRNATCVRHPWKVYGRQINGLDAESNCDVRLLGRKTDSSREKIMPRLQGLLEVGAAEERTL
jgi:hypothetical protein